VAPFVTPLTGPPDVAVCPRAGVANAAAKAMNRRKFRCVCVPISLSMVFHEGSQGRSHGFGSLLAVVTPAAPTRQNFGAVPFSNSKEGYTFLACL